MPICEMFCQGGSLEASYLFDGTNAFLYSRSDPKKFECYLGFFRAKKCALEVRVHHPLSFLYYLYAWLRDLFLSILSWTEEKHRVVLVVHLFLREMIHPIAVIKRSSTNFSFFTWAMRSYLGWGLLYGNTFVATIQVLLLAIVGHPPHVHESPRELQDPHASRGSANLGNDLSFGPGAFCFYGGPDGDVPLLDDDLCLWL